MRRFFRLLLTLLLLVLPLPELDELADGRLSVRYDLDQILLLAASDLQCFFRRHNTDHLPIFIDHANFRYTNILVHTNARIARRHDAAEPLHALLYIRIRASSWSTRRTARRAWP